MAHASLADIGGYVKVVQGLPPLANVAATRNGASIDRRGYNSCVLVSHAGAVTGSPSAQALDVKLQDSADGTTFADISTSIVTAAFSQKTTGTAELRELNIPLEGVRRYVRVVEVVGSFTGGTSPTFPHSACVVLGGKDTLPAT